MTDQATRTLSQAAPQTAAKPAETRAAVCLPTTALREDIAFFTRTLGLRLDMIWPADNPAVCVFSGHGLRVRLEGGTGAPPGMIRITTADPDAFAGGERSLTAPGGTRVEVEALDPPLVIPPTQHAFVVRRLKDQAPWVIGRAGMRYRDLVPSRLGGSIIASHIAVPAGPVPDMVHYHKVGFQLIFCYRGWVDLVYEDQGEPFRLSAGDCVIQPPTIRHRVLEASEGLQVIEIGVPAEHVTEIDHQMTLPNGRGDPARTWDGQRFVLSRAADASWAPFRIPGLVCRDTGIAEGTQGVAGVQVVRRGEGAIPATRHDGDILFTFVMEGTMTLTGEGEEPRPLTAGDAFVIPPGMVTRYTEPSDDLALLEVALPPRFGTHLISELG